MLNPDGVINGNTRVSLAGWDLNRKWSNPIEQLFPTVYHLKQQLAHFQSHGRVAIYCDLHGHSINRNIFTYGCYNAKKKPTSSDDAKSLATPTLGPAAANTTTSAATSPDNHIVKTDPRVFPMIVARHAPCFSFASCDFSVHKSKLTTARVVVNQDLGVTNSYTLEASFCGPDFGAYKDTQFSTSDLEEMGRSWCQSLIVYYGLTAQVKALEVERERQSTVSARSNLSAVVPSPSSRQIPRALLENGLFRIEAEDEESRITTDLLLDCEAAISTLFTHSGMHVNDRKGSDDDISGMDSDLSGAGDEPIPPSPDGRTQQRSPQAHTERKKQQNDDALIAADDEEEGYSSAPEDFPSRKNRTSKSNHVRKKAGRRKHARSSLSSKQKSQTSRKGDSKSKKKKKRKSKSELQCTSVPIPAPQLGPKIEDATEEPPVIALSSPTSEEPIQKTFPKKVVTSRRPKSISGRPKSSYESPKSISSAILKATMNADLASSRASLRHRPAPENPTTSNTLLVLPSVLDRSSRSGSVRILKTAPASDQEYPTIEDRARFSLARIRSELPALQNSGRDEEQQRHLRHQGQENDDIFSDEGYDANSERSEPEAYTSSF
ncbi:unnamed protein product [Phytophthora fragariaefolia]|uniref:Unnamed protein product n=1 Tax=Phytophthora fragariaefolia TaxID=1490495 RepID=A0A9W6Y2P7_9STRA|nr:unnamed protein product [Phytophthora fragariaefolia]